MLLRTDACSGHKASTILWVTEAKPEVARGLTAVGLRVQRPVATTLLRCMVPDLTPY